MVRANNQHTGFKLDVANSTDDLYIRFLGILLHFVFYGAVMPEGGGAEGSHDFGNGRRGCYEVFLGYIHRPFRS